MGEGYEGILCSILKDLLLISLKLFQNKTFTHTKWSNFSLTYLNTIFVDIWFSQGIDLTARVLLQKTCPIVKSFPIARPPSEEN